MLSLMLTTYVKKLNEQPEVFCCFLTVFNQCKKYALFGKDCIQHIIRKHNRSFGKAIASVSFLVSKQVLRCQWDNLTCYVSLEDK